MAKQIVLRKSFDVSDGKTILAKTTPKAEKRASQQAALARAQRISPSISALWGGDMKAREEAVKAGRAAKARLSRMAARVAATHPEDEGGLSILIKSKAPEDFKPEEFHPTNGVDPSEAEFLIQFNALLEEERREKEAAALATAKKVKDARSDLEIAQASFDDAEARVRELVSALHTSANAEVRKALSSELAQAADLVKACRSDLAKARNKEKFGGKFSMESQDYSKEAEAMAESMAAQVKAALGL